MNSSSQFGVSSHLWQQCFATELHGVHSSSITYFTRVRFERHCFFAHLHPFFLQLHPLGRRNIPQPRAIFRCLVFRSHPPAHLCTPIPTANRSTVPQLSLLITRRGCALCSSTASVPAVADARQLVSNLPLYSVLCIGRRGR